MRPDLRAFSNADVTNRATLATHGNQIFQYGAAGYAGLRGDNAMPSDDYVMGDLNEVVDLGALSDDCILKSPAVDCRVGSDFNTILNYDPAYLAYFIVSSRPHCKAKAILADPGAGVDDHMITDQGMCQGGARAQEAVPADRNSISNDGASGYTCATANKSLWTYNRASFDNGALLNARGRVNQAGSTGSEATHLRELRIWIKQLQ